MIAGKTLPLAPSAAHAAARAGGEVCGHLGQEKMQPPVTHHRASPASQLHPITAQLMVFALIKAPTPGALSILKTKVLRAPRESLNVYLVGDKPQKLKGEGNKPFISFNYLLY